MCFSLTVLAAAAECGKADDQMKEIFKSYLFDKHYFVSDGKVSSEDAFEVMFSLANLFGIRITSSRDLLEREMITFAGKQLGIGVPKPFYKGFPRTVRALSPDELLFDQLVHYAVTYGLGHFDQAGHSLFEADFERTAFKENVQIRDFAVITEEEAVSKLEQMIADLLKSTRPLSPRQYALVLDYLGTYDLQVTDVASKQTAVRLLLDTRDLKFADFLSLPDVIRLVDELNWRVYGNEDLKQLNLKNQDRKFIAQVLDSFLAGEDIDITSCYEKKAIWNGLLHHLHYHARTDEGKAFAAAMRTKGNSSVYAAFEKAMAAGGIREAADVILKGKGSGALLRHLDYLISRCQTEEDIRYILSRTDTNNVIILIQLLLRYARAETPGKGRTFTFTKHELLKVHQETDQEKAFRKSMLTKAQTDMVRETLTASLQALLKGRLGRVYIDPDMKNYALPLAESTSQGGFGVLASGTHIHIGEMKKIRAFTYWEKVDDIDLSVLGLTEAGRQKEFSWRTMAGSQSAAITYSGDQTAGFNGGSEYFDIDTDAFRKMYPGIRYLVFCDNVFSAVPFDQCICRAGYMLRDIEDSGQVFEPKTVRSAFTVNCQSTFAYLFGIDLETNDFIWLNTARSGSQQVAGEMAADFLIDDFHMTEVMNVYRFFEMMAAEIVLDPAAAEVIVTDKEMTAPEGAELIREYDFERMLALINQR